MAKPDSFPWQTQSQPGYEYKMNPEPEIIRKSYKSSDKLKGKKAIITGGDSGIGRSELGPAYFFWQARMLPNGAGNSYK